MNDSAIISRAAERRLATSARLTAESRRLTAERGLNGFTIEEVCSEVGVSRRTFFNYFPSKEEAVFGIHEAEEAARFVEEFQSREARGWAAVVDDLIDLAIDFARAAGIDAAEHAEFHAVLEREPKLLARLIGMEREREQQLIEMIAEREGVPVTDPRARAVVDVVSTVMRSTVMRLSDPDVAADFGAAILNTLAAHRAVLNP